MSPRVPDAVTVAILVVEVLEAMGVRYQIGVDDLLVAARAAPS